MRTYSIRAEADLVPEAQRPAPPAPRETPRGPITLGEMADADARERQLRWLATYADPRR